MGRLTVAAVAVGVVAAGGLAIANADTSNVQSSVIVSDTFDRTVSGGWGSAGVGGAYKLSSPAAFSVAAGTGNVIQKPGITSRATLSGISAADVEASVDRAVSELQVGTASDYLDLRVRDANSSAYGVRIKIQPGGRTNLLIIRESGSTALPLVRMDLPVPVIAAEPVTMQILATGTDPVVLKARAWPTGTATPGWQLTYSDSGNSRIVRAGAVSLAGYLSANGSSSVTSTANLSVTSQTPVVSTSQTPVVSQPVLAAPSGSFGSAAVGTASYAVPGGALFVSPSGSDAAAGTIDAPVKTVATALNMAATGQTVVLRGGVYHESVNPGSRTGITVQSYPGEAVWFDGSSVVPGWTLTGDKWVHNGWMTEFPSWSSFSTGSDDSAFINPAYPMAAHPDQIWIDGVAQKQVSTAGQVVAGTFYVDYAAKQLYLGSNPAGHEVRASDLSTAFVSNAAGTTVRGIGVRRYGTCVCALGALRLTGTGATIENVVADENAAAGISVSTGDNIRISHVTTDDNGLEGILANATYGLQLTGSQANGNNTEHFNASPVSGGIKITRSRNVLVKSNEVSLNTTNGLWLDESTYNVQVADNRIMSNGGNFGFLSELSTKVQIVGNLVARNSGKGIQVINSSNVAIWNNTMVGNTREFDAYQDGRNITDLSVPGHDPRQPAPDPTMSWAIGQIVFKNNILVNEGHDDYSFVMQDSTQGRSLAQIDLISGNNVYQQGAAGTVLVQTSGGNAGYKTLAAANGVGLENASRTMTSGALNANLSPAVALTTIQSSIATSIPADIAALLGSGSGASVIGSPVTTD